MRARIAVGVIIAVLGAADLLAQRGGRKVSGTVTEAASNRAVSGAVVEYFESGSDTQTTTTDSKGYFEFESGTLGVVVVTEPGFATESRRWPSMQGGAVLRIELSTPAGVEGIVVDAATSVGLNAVITTMTDEAGGITSSSTDTDSSGAFQLADLRGGPTVLIVSAEGFAPDWRVLDLRTGRLQEVRIGMLLEAAVSGTVVDGSGEPVSDAWVGVGYEDETGAYGMLESFSGGEPWSNTEGLFGLFGLIPDVPISLQAEDPDGNLSDVVTVVVPPGMQQQNVVLTIQ